MAKKKPKKAREADTEGKSKDDSWVKYYCVVFLVLTCVVGYLFFKYRGQRMEFEKATVQAKRFITGEGIPEFDRNEVPTTIPGLAQEVFQYVTALKDATGGQDGGDAIPTAVLNRAEAELGAGRFARTGMGDLDEDKNRRAGYVTISRRITYEATNLRNLSTLLYNLEAKPPLKVFQIRWQLQEKGKQEAKPFDAIIKPVIKVGVRRPLGADDS